MCFEWFLFNDNNDCEVFNNKHEVILWITDYDYESWGYSLLDRNTSEWVNAHFYGGRWDTFWPIDFLILMLFAI